MNLPIDPTDNDISAQELIQNLPSQAARHRVLQASDIAIDVDDRTFTETLDELSQIELRRVVSQLQFAGKRTVYYYQIDGLRQVSPTDVSDRAGDGDSSGAYGSEVKTVIEDHDRMYLVCSVPETGTQAQLSFSEEDRETTVATFKPRSQLLAVRAPNETTADATVGAVMSYLELADRERISFLDGRFRGRFEDACVEGYSTLRLRNTNSDDHSTEIEVRSEKPEAGNVADVRNDAVVDDLFRRNDTQLHSATGLVSFPTEIHSAEAAHSLHPRVTIGFPDGRARFEQFVPEQILIKFDDVIRESF